MNYKFYRLNSAVDTKETGPVFPATQSFDNYNFSAPNSVHKLNHFGFPDFIPDIRFKLARSAKLCDVLSQGAIAAYGLLISEKFKAILDDYTLAPHSFYKASIIDKNSAHHSYYWIHFYWKNNVNFIDYRASTFYLKNGLEKIYNLKINNFEDFNALRNNSKFTVKFDKLILVKNPEFDIWPMPLRGELVVNNSFKESIENIDLTGIKFTANKMLYLNQ